MTRSVSAQSPPPNSRRPNDSRLDNTKIQSIGCSPPDWRKDLTQVLQAISR
ncbi:sugar nucleotide-binding protein [Proteobacteria bacterium 005FR1]|nr:sugar nucleotide-binding protein [Proteobacteria bacterium 005FR1]